MLMMISLFMASMQAMPNLTIEDAWHALQRDGIKLPTTAKGNGRQYMKDIQIPLIEAHDTEKRPAVTFSWTTKASHKECSYITHKMSVIQMTTDLLEYDYQADCVLR